MSRASRFDGPEPSCLYPDEKEIARLVLSPSRARSWPSLAIVLERSGLPRIDVMMGGRYWPAVRAFFDRMHHVDKSDRSDPSYRPPVGGRTGGVYDPPEKIRPEKRFSRMIDQGLERRRKAAEKREQAELPPPADGNPANPKDEV